MAFVPRARPENALGAPPGERPQSLKCLLSRAFGWAPPAGPASEFRERRSRARARGHVGLFGFQRGVIVGRSAQLGLPA
jgi:hypothetical protein